MYGDEEISVDVEIDPESTVFEPSYVLNLKHQVKFFFSFVQETSS